MSPRAACRLERLGFKKVYDFVPGKLAWLAMGWPREGTAAAVPNAPLFTARVDRPLLSVDYAGSRRPQPEPRALTVCWPAPGVHLCGAFLPFDAVAGFCTNLVASDRPVNKSLLDSRGMIE